MTSQCKRTIFIDRVRLKAIHDAVMSIGKDGFTVRDIQDITGITNTSTRNLLDKFYERMPRPSPGHVNQYRYKDISGIIETLNQEKPIYPRYRITWEDAMAVHEAITMYDKDIFSIKDLQYAGIRMGRARLNTILQKYYVRTSRGERGECQYIRQNNLDIFNSLPTKKGFKSQSADIPSPRRNDIPSKDNTMKKKAPVKLMPRTAKIISDAAMAMGETFTLADIAPRIKGISTWTIRIYADIMFERVGKKASNVIYRRRDENPNTSHPLPQKETVLAPSLPASSPIQTIVDQIMSMSNEDKAKIIYAVIPMFSVDDMLGELNELYPVYLLPNVKQGDKLYHPMIGLITIGKAEPKLLSFYGHGKTWHCTRNGNLSIDGKVQRDRILFRDMDDYCEYMRERMKEDENS